MNFLQTKTRKTTFFALVVAFITALSLMLVSLATFKDAKAAAGDLTVKNDTGVSYQTLTYNGGNAYNDPKIYLGNFISGTSGKHCWGLETYGSNADLVLINDKTITQWRAVNANSVKRMFIISEAVGFHFDDGNTLRMPKQSGSGTVVSSITFKAGFTLATLASDSAVDGNNWSTGTTVLGTFAQDTTIYYNTIGADEIWSSSATGDYATLTAKEEVINKHNDEANSPMIGYEGTPSGITPKMAWGLDEYVVEGSTKNADLLLINGQSVTYWKSQGGASPAVARIFLVGSAIGFHLDNGALLYIDGMSTTSGAKITSVTIKSGFTIVTPSVDKWGDASWLSSDCTLVGFLAIAR